MREREVFKKSWVGVMSLDQKRLDQKLFGYFEVQAPYKVTISTKINNKVKVSFHRARRKLSQVNHTPPHSKHPLLYI